MKSNVFIIHGTEGNPEENWFPWLKGQLEARGYQVFVPQFPSPPGVTPVLGEWLEVLKNYEEYINEDTIFVGHSLGAMFILNILQRADFKIKLGILVAPAVGYAFGGLDFDWENIKNKAQHFEVFHSDNDPYVSLENAQKLAQNLGVEVNIIPDAGHFNATAGYLEFPELLKKIDKI